MSENLNIKTNSSSTINVKISNKITATVYNRDRVIERRDSIIAFQRKKKK